MIYEKERVGRATAVIGLQYGSEGKGAISEYLAPAASSVVRIGAANAGHTVMYKGNPYVMRQIPCGWINPQATLVIGISAFISLPVLLQEIEMIDSILPIKKRLIVDRHAHVITDKQILDEANIGLAERISSTSAKSALGIGMATADKALRSSSCLMAKDVKELKPYLGDTVDFLNNQLDHDQIVIFEGTQGFGLSVDHGYFPYTTSRDTTAQSLFAGTGVNPYGFGVEVIGVLRALPIRVGGPSGPFDPDSTELTWEQVAVLAGDTRDITERTSVTKSVRRVASFSMKGIKKACQVNRPTELALTFADHIDASVYEKKVLTPKVEAFIERLEYETGVPVTLIKTGPHTTIDRIWYRQSMLRKIA